MVDIAIRLVFLGHPTPHKLHCNFIITELQAILLIAFRSKTKWFFYVAERQKRPIEAQIHEQN
jgi:hypothetical protein